MDDSLVKKEQEQETKTKLRCAHCNKKLGIAYFKCRCENYYCSYHRYTTIHDCAFDYKSFARNALAKENPRCVKEKLPKF
jgi:predicted nucleic acid binding AN1-type Zn finger protein